MNRTFTFHPRSVALGLSVGAVAFFCMGQIGVHSLPSYRVEFGPHPRDFVQIQMGSPFTVPTGKLFVLTALGVNGYKQDVTLQVNSTSTFKCEVGQMLSGAAEIPRGLSFSAGNVIEPVTAPPGSSVPFAWGYLSEL